MAGGRREQENGRMTDSVKPRVHYWHPHEPVRALALEAARGAARVLEIGPGDLPFPLATEFVDWLPRPAVEGRPVHVLDLNVDRLPFPDQSIDFLYTRHTLEDLYNPLHACREIARVARAGYIETPSPLAESCRGVDASSPPWRGYVHHHSLLWAEAGRLILLLKIPLIEHLIFGNEHQIAGLLESSPIYWNTCFFWTGPLQFQLLQHDRDFSLADLQHGYGSLVLRGMYHAVEDSRRLAARLA
jgi:hypothetical protein